ncbi:NRDE family protein [Zavarzinella formosa]|uniref:NRDE family protein n=1 Tax=Zavarzinella formosa TaxID=360055 RepID=UPI00037C38BC|nr:NRDE family protein [Zavarzinella formosa]
MCTLSIVPLPVSRVRFAFNRDERRTRPAGLPPIQREYGRHSALHPIDPASGGTWLAVNDAGLVMAILNQNPVVKPDGVPRRSRGKIIAELLSCDTPASALNTAEKNFRFEDFAPFQLILAGQGSIARIKWDGQQSMVSSQPFGGNPLMVTSSGLGDHLVDDVRRELFDSFLATPPEEWEKAQRAFHRHQWPDRPHLSVNMARETTRTVSHSVIELTESLATFEYWPDAPDKVDSSVIHSLKLTGNH